MVTVDINMLNIIKNNISFELMTWILKKKIIRKRNRNYIQEIIIIKKLPSVIWTR